MPTPKKPTRAELVAMLQTRGWDMVTGSETVPVKGRTLKDVALAAHARHKKGEATGLIKQIETAVEVDMVQLQELWAHLGLSM